MGGREREETEKGQEREKKEGESGRERGRDGLTIQ